MKYFFDTEFVEDGRTIDLISIAIVAEDGREYYAISKDFDMARAKAHPFVSAHVLPHLPADQSLWKHRGTIADEVRDFAGFKPEFWADFASYDWVALCQLYGPMADLPQNWPYFCRDVQQLRKMLDVPKFTVLNDGDHNALLDARECKARHDVLWKKFQER